MRSKFWLLPLAELSASEWEALCDGCGKCCLIKLTDADNGALYYTDVACELFDSQNCRCKDYSRRTQRVPDCMLITLNDEQVFSWLPVTCAYRLRWLDQPLPCWHPLICESDSTLHEEGHSVRGKTIDADQVDDIREHVIDWVES